MSNRNLLSILLIAAGAFLLFLGARDYWDSIWGQHEAARQWEETARQPAAPPAEPWRPPDLERPPDLGAAFARLSIPRLGCNWFVFEGTGSKSLRLGPGHMPGTALPGAAGNCIIAGHRDLHFRILKDIRKGDEIVVDTRMGEYRYRVVNMSIVSPTNTKALWPTTEPVLNLITCYPFYYLGPAPRRFIVEARLEAPRLRFRPSPSVNAQTPASGRNPS